jgi:hypothetical protein
VTDHIVLDDYLAVAAGQYRGDERRKIAALALHGQPFGFHKSDVKMLRLIEGTTVPTFYSLDEKEGVVMPDTLNAAILSLAARIEALLPPEAKP